MLECSRRWHESLNPNINHGRWSLLEDQVLREAVQTYGRRWTEIVERYFPNRTPIAAKKRFEWWWPCWVYTNIQPRYAQCFQSKTRLSKTELRQEQHNTSRPASASPKEFKKEESDGSLAQFLYCVPDYSQNGSMPPKMTHQQGDRMRFQTDSPLSTPVTSSVGQFATSFDITPASYTAPNTPHYSPPYSRDESLGSSSVAEYPIVSDVAHSWVPAESQSAYSGSPFVFHETGYFDPSYTFRWTGMLRYCIISTANIGPNALDFSQSRP